MLTKEGAEHTTDRLKKDLEENFWEKHCTNWREIRLLKITNYIIVFMWLWKLQNYTAKKQVRGFHGLKVVDVVHQKAQQKTPGMENIF